MVNVDIEKELYQDIKRLVKEKKYDYASVKFFVQKAIYNELIKSKSSEAHVFDKLKEFVRLHPELKSKIDEAYNSEVDKLRGVR